jgi:ubiquinone/menaquinone biosynthesis C-methylase UbiE
MSPAGNQASSGVARAFDYVSRVYDVGPLQRIVYRGNHDAVIGALRRHAPRRVLDVGCGTGILTARIAEDLKPEAVYGIDASEGMLQKARARSEKIDWLHGAAEHLPLNDGSVDAVVTTEAFQFFDQPAALREFHRVLAPGGHVVVAVLTPRVSIERLTRNAPARWPTRGQMRGMMEEAGLEVEEQRMVRTVLGPFSPGVATVAVRR